MLRENRHLERVHVIDGNHVPSKIRGAVVVDFHPMGTHRTFDHHNQKDKGRTSTAIVLEAARRGLHEKRRPLVTNHLDTDSVLSVYALLRPNRAKDFTGIFEKAALLGDHQRAPRGEDAELAEDLHHAIEGMIDHLAGRSKKTREELNGKEKTEIMHELLLAVDEFLIDQRKFSSHIEAHKKRIEGDKKRVKSVNEKHGNIAIVESDGPYLHPISRHSMTNMPVVLMQHNGSGKNHFVVSVNPSKAHIINPEAFRELSEMEFQRRGGRNSSVSRASVKWGGRDRAGGSHRKSGSVLGAEEVRAVLSRHIERPNHNH